MNPLLLSAALRRAKTPAFKLLGRSLVAGTPEHGYFGEFSAAEVITGDALATLAGIGGSTTGIASNSTAGWLGFSIDGKKLLIAKRAFRHSLSWNGINAVGAVVGKPVTIKNLPFLVRLPSGSNKDPADGVTAYDHATTHGSEWNRMMYHVAAVINSSKPGEVSSEGITTGDWARFSNADLGVGSGFNGTYTWCKERWGTGSERLIRGSIDVSNTQRYSPTVNNGYVGWRPVLELVE